MLNCNINPSAAATSSQQQQDVAAGARCGSFLTCSAVVSLRELDLHLVLSGDVLDAAAFGAHDGAMVALRDGHLHGHLGLLLERERRKKEENTKGEHTKSRFASNYK